MTISDANPIQFWATGVESYNEKAICGVYSECYCQIFELDDNIFTQVTGAAGRGLELRMYDESSDLLETFLFNEISSGTYSVAFDFRSYISSVDTTVQFKIYTQSDSIQDFDSWTNFGSGTSWSQPAGAGNPWVCLGLNIGATSKYLVADFNSYSGDSYDFTFTWQKTTNTGFGELTAHIGLMDSGGNILVQQDFAKTGSDTIYAEDVTLLAPADGDRIAMWIDSSNQNSNNPDVQSLTINEGSDRIEIFHSDCVDFRDSHECDLTIVYTNGTDFDGIDFESGSPSTGPFTLRVHAQFWKETNPQEEEDHELSNGTIVTLRQKIEEKRLLELGYMPNYMHKKLQKILMMDSILIDGDYWKRRDSYESDNINRYGLKKGQVWLTKYDSVKKNTP